MRAVVMVMYIFAICFTFAAAILELGVTTTHYISCRAGVYVCLVFYFSTKILIYMFLVERAHALRAFYCRRHQDWVWVTGTAILALGWGTIAVIAFLWPSVDVDGENGKCRFGWPLKVTIPVVAYDVFINVALTGLFTHMLQSGFRLSFRLPSTAASRLQAPARRASFLIKLKPQFEDGEYEEGVNQANLKAIRTLLHKTIIGCIIVMIPTVVNLALLTQGIERSWLCFTICTIDGEFLYSDRNEKDTRLMAIPVTLQVVVIHWLTNDPTDPPRAENNQLNG